MKLKQRALTPSIARAILAGTLLLTIATGIGVFVFGQQQLSAVAEETRKSTTDAESSSNELQTLTTLKNRLKEQDKDVERAAKIVSITKNYSYQDQVVQDLVNYANASGVVIKSIDFSANNSSAASKSTNAATITKAPTGTKSISATVTLNTPVAYDSLRDFIYRIEKNLFQMQISNLTLSSNKDTGGIVVDALTVTAYVR
ncbi:hypothetical protein J5A52_01045 [TM7 phylum sp. oral taxon 349]|nr:hypothetical protein J5A52_01045 [TM7 phylum sp. oral taxon 349]RKV99496.1 MAG: hypothetical protein D8G53_00525 [Candidatus Saccharimonas sp.]